MTKQQLIGLVKRRLMSGVADNSVWETAEFEIASNIGAAMQLAATRVMRDPETRPRLVQEYSVTLDGSGVGDLSTAAGSVTGAANELFLEGIDLGSVVDENGASMCSIPHYMDFISPQFTGFAYYHITNQKQIRTRAANTGQVCSATDIVGATGPIRLRASYCPATVPGFPLETEDILINAVVEITLMKMQGGQATAP